MAGPRYFFSQSPLQTNRITVIGLGIEEKMPPILIDRPHGRSDWLLMVFFHAVSLSHQPGAQLHNPGTFMIWPPRARQTYGNRDATWNHSWVHLKGRRIADLVSAAKLPTSQPILLPDPAICNKYLWDLHHELNGQWQPDATLCLNILHNWLIDIGRQSGHAAPARRIPPALVAVHRHIDENFQLPLTLSAIARQAGMSVPHLCDQFRHHYGTTIKQYIIHRRLSRASYLLKDTSLTVTAVARMVGYTDVFQFSRLFKQHIGHPPNHARKRTK